MKSKAILMTLAMMSAALAGCTGSDGVTEIDDETLQQLFDDNIQDFMNNTSVTVNQEIHYHNNTTSNNYENTNEYNNTTNVDGGEVINHNTDNSVNNFSGSNIGSTMQMFTVDWDVGSEDFEDIAQKIVLGITSSDSSGNNNSNGSGSGTTDANSDSSLLYITYYNNNIVEFRSINCAEWMHYYQFDDDGWERWLSDNYGWGDDRSSVANSIYNHFRNNDASDQGYSALTQCPTSYTYSEPVILYEIELQEGQAVSFLNSVPNVVVDINCADGFGTGLGNGTSGYMGGQAECTITGSTVYRTWLSYEYVYEADGSPEWNIYYDYNGITRSYFTSLDYDYGAPSQFAVYFTMHNVVVYDIDEE